jgi:LPS-assembly lipoprotein
MAWHELGASFRQLGRTGLTRAGLALALAAPLAGCFQPLYGEGTSPDRPGLRDSFRSVDVKQIDAVANTGEARLAVQIRNDLLFNFTGGSSSGSPTHELIIKLSGTRSAVTIDRETKLPTDELYSLRTTYTLTEIATKKVVVTGRATTSVSYDSANQQRFARIMGLQDAERRAAKVVADNITSRLASYFVGGG